MFFLSSSSGNPMMLMLGCLILSQKSLRLFLFLLILFSTLLHLFPPFFHLTYPVFCLSYSTVVSLQSAFDLSFCIIHYWLTLFFISSMSLLNIYCIFSILVSSLFICNFILFSRFWIIFTIIILNCFSDRLPISSSLVWFDGHLSCSFTCWIFLCLYILFRFLCLGWPFCRLEVCGSSLWWRLFPVGGVGLVACQGFLVRGACICVLVGGAGSLLSEVQWRVQ